MSHKIAKYGYEHQNKLRTARLDADPSLKEMPVGRHEADLGIPWDKMSPAAQKLRRNEMRKNTLANRIS